jgi:hypothetical protein
VVKRVQLDVRHPELLGQLRGERRLPRAARADDCDAPS